MSQAPEKVSKDELMQDHEGDDEHLKKWKEKLLNKGEVNSKRPLLPFFLGNSSTLV